MTTEGASRYGLITAAFNEEEYLPATILSVLGQSVLPRTWIIVSDGSTDRTDEIIQDYSNRFPFIRYIRREKSSDGVGFISKVHALNHAVGCIDQAELDFIGILDADITFESKDYFKELMFRFYRDPQLGISGGAIHVLTNGKFRERGTNRVDSVAGAVQFFRKECFREIGRFQPIEAGGEDTVGSIGARAKGWKVATALDLVVYHHKNGDDLRGGLREGFREGKMDYLMGYHPLFETLKCIKRITEKPYFMRSVARWTAFFLMAVKKKERVVPREIVDQFRKEQKARMSRLFFG